MDGRTYGRTDGRTFPPSILLGRLYEVDLKMALTRTLLLTLSDPQGGVLTLTDTRGFPPKGISPGYQSQAEYLGVPIERSHSHSRNYRDFTTQRSSRVVRNFRST